MSSVFKFYAPKQHYFKTLSRVRVNFSYPRHLNDEFERASYLIEPYQHFCEEIGWRDSLKDMFEKHGIASFTNAPQSGWDILWENYGNSGRGFAVEYDKESLKSLPEDLGIPVYLQDVDYCDERFNLDDFGKSFHINDESYTIQQCIKDYHSGDPKSIDRLFQYLRLIKNQGRWACEQESRMIIGNLNKSPYLHPGAYGYELDLPSNTIRSVIVGKNMAEADKSILKGIAKQHKFNVIDNRK